MENRYFDLKTFLLRQTPKSVFQNQLRLRSSIYPLVSYASTSFAIFVTIIRLDYLRSFVQHAVECSRDDQSLWCAVFPTTSNDALPRNREASRSTAERSTRSLNDASVEKQRLTSDFEGVLNTPFVFICPSLYKVRGTLFGGFSIFVTIFAPHLSSSLRPFTDPFFTVQFKFTSSSTDSPFGIFWREDLRSGKVGHGEESVVQPSQSSDITTSLSTVYSTARNCLRETVEILEP